MKAKQQSAPDTFKVYVNTGTPPVIVSPTLTSNYAVKRWIQRDLAMRNPAARPPVYSAVKTTPDGQEIKIEINLSED